MNCICEGNNIFKLEYGNKECIGVTASAYKDLENTLEQAIVKAEEYKLQSEEYKKKLVEHGIIKIPKSTDEIQQEILSGLNNLANVVGDIGKRLEVLENESSSNNEGGKTIQHRTNENSANNGKGKGTSK